MKILKELIITNENKNDYKKLKECGRLTISKGVEVKFSVLTTSGNIYLSQNAKLDAPVLTTSGYIDLRENAKLDAPVLTTSGNIDLSQNAKLDAPVLTTSGYIYLRENAKLDAPVLTTSGYIDLRENAKLITKLTKRLNYTSIDNTMFVIEAEKTSKGINILSGYILKSFSKNKIIKEVSYVAQKDNFSAHGETLKKAISDLQFKLISEKLKKEPINKNTVITINYYRLLTGACEQGVKSWMQSNNIKKEEYKASELLPLLEKSNAYGLDKFKSMITF